MSFHDPFLSFNKESIRFMAARSFLARSAIASMEGNKELSESFKIFQDAVKPTYADLFVYVSAHLFISYISNFETFLQEISAQVLKKHPKKIGSISFSLNEILDSVDKDALIHRAIDEHMNKLMYQRPAEYLNGICDLLSIPSELVAPFWPVFVEAKARRDLGVHSNWKCNATYIKKIKEVGLSTSLAIGESAVPDADDYILEFSSKMTHLAQVITTEVVRIHGAM